MITLLTIASVIAFLTAIYAVATKAEQVEVFASKTTLTDAEVAAETGRYLATTPPPTQSDWQFATVNALNDAEELLDMLENQGYAERELVVLGDSSFAVRWR
jgi:hypothetical protein